MIIAKPGFLMLIAEDTDKTVYMTGPKWMAGWLKTNWPDAAIHKSEARKGWVETICTPEEWRLAAASLSTPEPIISEQAPFIYPTQETLNELSKLCTAPSPESTPSTSSTPT